MFSCCHNLPSLKLASECNALPGDSTMYLGNIDYSQPKLGFEGLPELERFVNCFEPNTAYSLGLY